MTVERYTPIPPITEYLVVDVNTTYADIRAWAWMYVPVSGEDNAVIVGGVPVSVGNRISHEGQVFVGDIPGMQLINAANALYVIGGH